MNRAALACAAAVVSAAVTLTASPAHALGGGFVRDSAACPTGKVVIGGGAQVVGEGSADFLTVIQESAPATSGGSPRVWMTAMKNNDPSIIDPSKERVMIRADADVTYDRFMTVINTFQTAGFYQVGLINEDIS